MRIYALNEGNYSVNKDKIFSPLQQQESTGMRMAVRPFMIELHEEIVLLDAGLGLTKDGMPMIHYNIKNSGSQPGKVSCILLSHLHKDHINGLVDKNDAGWSLNFPNAKIYLQRREYDFAISKQGNPSFDFDVLDFIIDNSVVEWLDEDKGLICPGIYFEVSGGHTPFHQVFFIEEKDEVVFYGADNLPTEQYLKYPMAFKSDFDGKKAMQDRVHWEVRAKSEKWKILLYHDMKQEIKLF